MGDTNLPKPLRSIGAKPLLTRVMDLYPEKTSFVIGLGYKSSWVEQVATISAEANNQELEFFITDSWRVPVKGLTDTILDGQHLLQESFIFHAVDTLIPKVILSDLSGGDQNTVLVCRPSQPGFYRTILNGEWRKIYFDTDTDVKAYTGVALIHDYKVFWDRIVKNSLSAREEGEVLGIIPAMCEPLEIQEGEWFDCGSLEGILRAQSRNARQDVVLERNNEAIWHIGSEMIKFHIDEIFIKHRVLRAQALGPFVPEVKLRGSNIYSYKREVGITLSEAEPEKFREFLKFLKDFWGFESLEMKFEYHDHVDVRYLDFYREKTLSRVNKFLGEYPDYYVTQINGNQVRPIMELLSSVDWENLARVQLSRSHGDLHPDNVLVVNSTLGFTLLDWRQDIAGSVDRDGDIYYDLAKIKHGLIVDHAKVVKGEFLVRVEGTNAMYSMLQTEKKRQWAFELDEFLTEYDLDFSKVDLITALIFLNIAILHHVPYDRFLFVLGHDLLGSSLKNLGI